MNTNNHNLDNDHVLLQDYINKICTPLVNEPPAVLNLSTHTLTANELSLLERGLNFCPTPGEPNLGDLRRDLDDFHRRLKIKAFFYPNNTSSAFLSQTTQSPSSSSDTESDDDNSGPSNDSPIDYAIKRSKVTKSRDIPRPAGCGISPPKFEMAP